MRVGENGRRSVLSSHICASRGAGLAAAAHICLRIAVGAGRYERRHALMASFLSSKGERSPAKLRSEKRSRGRSVMAERRRGRRGVAGAARIGGR